VSDIDTADMIAMYVGGGLLVLGTVGVGILEMAVGASHPVSGEGQIVHEALIPLEVRSTIILLGLLIWGGYAVYKVAADTPTPGSGTPQRTDIGGAD
jgi:hypothetical protein